MNPEFNMKWYFCASLGFEPKLLATFILWNRTSALLKNGFNRLLST